MGKILQSNVSIRAKIELILPTNQYSLGEEINGELRISSEETFNANQTVVWLFCNECIKKTRTYPVPYMLMQQEDYWDYADIFRTYRTLFGPTCFPPGFVGKYQFALTIPLAGRESFYSVDRYVKWFLQPVIYVAGRPNVGINPVEVFVVRQQVNPVSPITKEIVREVVLVPCAYCSGLMPQTSIFCPNCGARKKA